MRWSNLFITTLKDNPADGKVPSHNLLVRAGYIRQVAAGIFSLLPLGQRVIQRISNIVREELNSIGAQEVLLPMVHPANLWQESGRWQVYGPQLLRLKDRKGFDFALAATAEEAMVALVRDEIKSYRRLPLHLYQIQDKFRDEDRPRAGLLRGREFIMKDGYSFHTTNEDAHREYQAVYGAYSKIFKRCGLNFRSVEADTGAIGGSMSHEFQVLAATGEDSIASCDSCEYAANVEKALAAPLAPKEFSEMQESDLLPTPGIKTISEVAKFLGKKETELLKTLIYFADDNLIAVVMRGDRELNEFKLKAYLKVGTLRAASVEEVKDKLKLDLGFIGPQDLKIPLYVDQEVTVMGPSIAGANQVDYHKNSICWGKNFSGTVLDLRFVQEAELCGRCVKGKYVFYRGIEVGHVFFLGTKYSAAMECNFLDQLGKLNPMIMGTYGIGITRVMAAAVEQNHDEHGIVWPMPLAPFQVILSQLIFNDTLNTVIKDLYESLSSKGISVLWDDREERAGVKFTDAELIGIPLQIIIGQSLIKDNLVELKTRKNREAKKIPLSSLVDELLRHMATNLS